MNGPLICPMRLLYALILSCRVLKLDLLRGCGPLKGCAPIDGSYLQSYVNQAQSAKDCGLNFIEAIARSCLSQVISRASLHNGHS